MRTEDMVLFPISETESQGMEDMRLVLFTGEDGHRAFFGTYTAYNGRQILPQLLEISGPQKATIHVLRGPYAQNKGMAMFPRKVEGKFAMIGRMDGENLFLLKSKVFLEKLEVAFCHFKLGFDCHFFIHKAL